MIFNQFVYGRIVLGIIAIWLVMLVFAAGRADCGWCGSAPCYDSSTCLSDCVCISSGDGTLGSCVQFN